MLNARPVRGLWRRLRWWANTILIVILFAIPWIRMGGEPLVLLDIPNRQFHVFGLVIFPQELYFLWLILAGLALALFFFTALAGRLWCGWACPQTVFTDVFAGVARRIQGWKGFRAPVRVAAWRKVATHVVWLVLAWIVGFHLVAYFRSPYDLLGALFQEGRIYPTAFAFHAVITLITYLDFAIVRQTFCKYLCPYARFQGVLFDRDSLVIGYDALRGEPRGKVKKQPRTIASAGPAGARSEPQASEAQKAGDCVDCGLCVAVCPTEIDIRHGLQMECIACTQCIDACNGVMESLERPKNLIGYRSLVGLERIRSVRILRPRVLVYGALLAGVFLAFGVLLERRLPMDLQVAHNRSALFSAIADARMGNAFTLHIQNRDRAAHEFHIRLEGDAAGEADDDFELVAGQNPVPVPATSAVQASVFVLARDGEPSGERIRFVLERADAPAERVVRTARFLTPGGSHGHEKEHAHESE